MSTELTAVERETLDAFRRGDPTEPRGDDDAKWVGFGLRCLLEAGRVLRAHATAFDGRVDLKADGSPATRLEHAVERDVRERLRRFEPAATFLGEETGGALRDSGFAVAVDPVDGTWGFLSETATWACVIAVLRDGQPFAGFLANPATGELAYALHGGDARLLRLAAFGEPPSAHVLPTQRRPEQKLLVCLHPSRQTEALQAALHDAWARGELAVVRSPGGSPAWGLVEAARGHHVYLNAWSGSRAQPFDLVAGALLLRGAGGEITDADGRAIDALSHAGPWIAAVDAERRARVAEIVRGAWPTHGSRAQPSVRPRGTPSFD
jgi:fructose-1,6-bisphosphatase/inositol monophosphatase family enzyme